MVVVTFLLGVTLIFGPPAIAALVGSRIPWPSLAFLVAWAATPALSVAFVILAIPVLRAVTPAGNDGSGVIMIPISAIATGLVAAIVAAVLSARRRRKANAVVVESSAP